MLRVGVVSYLNSKPLIEGLDQYSDLDLRLQVPARLLAGLASHDLDVALLPVIDYQRLAGLRVIPSGGIGSDGATLTVRIFSSVPMNQIHTLACDVESHTSVALARIVLAESFDSRPELTSLNERIGSQAARLLIGDKVVTQKPLGLDHQLDLGKAWKDLTGLPFVFAVWTARAGVALGDLPARLARAREAGLKNLDRIVEKFAIPGGWPRDLAMQYLGENLKFEIGGPQLAAIRKFHALAFKHGVIGEPRGLEIAGSEVV